MLCQDVCFDRLAVESSIVNNLEVRNLLKAFVICVTP